MKFWQVIFSLVIGAVLLGSLLLIITSQTRTHQTYIFPRYEAIIPTQVKTIYTPHLPSLDSIFSNDHGWVATLSAERIRTLVATGDVLPARQVNINIQEKQNPNWPFEKTKELLSKADITFINLETPLVSNCPLSNSGFTFCGDSKNVNGLLFAGVDVVNFANNHASNYGSEGVVETVHILEENNVLVSGVHGPVYKDIDGVTFAFLGYNDINIQPGTAQADEKLIKNEITRAKQNADIVVVQFHWGVEYTHEPSTRQKELAHFAIDQGADLVIGNHPHWYQAVELYNNKLITYSHGNFVFDQMWSQKTREGVVGKYVFYETELIDVDFIPILIKQYGQPEIITDTVHRQSILDIMKKVSL